MPANSRRADPFDRDTGGARVPHRKRRDPVRVNVLGRFHQLRKTRQRIPADIPMAIHLD